MWGDYLGLSGQPYRQLQGTLYAQGRGRLDTEEGELM